METLIEYAALIVGAAALALIVAASWLAWPDRSGRPGGEGFVPGNYDPHAHHGDGGDGVDGNHCS